MDDQEQVTTTIPGEEAIGFSFFSEDGLTQINARMWLPDISDGVPKAIIQIVHGMEEHIGRYEGFAHYLLECGFVVCAADMLGHGKSIIGPESLSCIPAKEGKDILISDVHILRKLANKMVRKCYSQDIPYFIFGHSMGSFIVRNYIAYHPKDVAGAILCGSGRQPYLLSKVANILARRIAKSKGEAYKSSFLEGLGAGAYAKKIKNARTSYDWLSTDEAVVDAYIADPLCGIPFSAGAYAALTDITGEIATVDNAIKVPCDLPILYIAGGQDPVGANGSGVKKAAEFLKYVGVKQVDVVLYKDMRHEILNEPGKRTVYNDITRWIDAILDLRRAL